MIQPNGPWKTFLKSHWDSLFGMDFMIVDTLFCKRFYLFIVLELISRMIIRSDFTDNPCLEFVKPRIKLFSEELSGKKTLIYDNTPQFIFIDFSWFNIEGVDICSYASNMNAFVERLNG